MNKVRCLHCHTTLESRHRHDFRGCTCPDEALRIYVDGGRDYVRRAYGEQARWMEIGEDGKEWGPYPAAFGSETPPDGTQ